MLKTAVHRVGDDDGRGDLIAVFESDELEFNVVEMVDHYTTNNNGTSRRTVAVTFANFILFKLNAL